MYSRVYICAVGMMVGVPLLLLVVVLVSLESAGGDYNAGFMRDFFARFPHLPAFSMFRVGQKYLGILRYCAHNFCGKLSFIAYIENNRR